MDLIFSHSQWYYNNNDNNNNNNNNNNTNNNYNDNKILYRKIELKMYIGV